LRAPDILGNIERSLIELCDAEAKRLTAATASVFSLQDLTEGRLVILVDALDEIPDDTGRVAVLSRIAAFHERYPACRVIVTSRDYNAVQSLAALKQFETYYLSPIDHKQAQKILKTFEKGKKLAPEKSQELIRRLEEVHGMELNPLLVTVFAATSDYSRQDIPANITELFKKFTEMMLGRWDATKGLKHQYHAPLKDFILTKIAFEMHKDKATKIPISRFDATLQNELQIRGLEADTEQLRDEIVNRSGLFFAGDDTIEFRHLLMQEFFAGRGIPSSQFLDSVIADPWWMRAVVFYFGEHPDWAAALKSAMGALEPGTTEAKYQSALTLGLALQACYLVEIKDKVDIYRWVVDALSNAKDEFLEADKDGKAFPLTRFIFYYLFGRDSVALSVLESRASEILAKWNDRHFSKEDLDLRKFWVLCGLIECGAMEEVERMLDDFKPSDPRLLLGVHMGCNVALQVRISTREQAQAAERICQRLSSQIDHLRKQLLDEVSGELLEVREGAIKALEARSKQPSS
jgi:hypothetical protein